MCPERGRLQVLYIGGAHLLRHFLIFVLVGLEARDGCSGKFTEFKCQLTVLEGNFHVTTLGELAEQYFIGERLFDFFGDEACHRTRTVCTVVTAGHQPFAGGAIEREPDGLALSSRNRYLSPEQRRTAVSLSMALKAVRDAVKAGGDPSAASAKAREDIVKAGFDSVDYVDVRDPSSLELVTEPGKPARVFGAARLGTTRLIDNWPVE